MARTAGTVELLISTSETEFINVNAEVTLNLYRENLENAEEFTCLGSRVSADSNITREVRTRIAKAAVAFSSLNNI